MRIFQCFLNSYILVLVLDGKQNNIFYQLDSVSLSLSLSLSLNVLWFCFRVWPMSLMTRALTTDDEKEISTLLSAIKNSTCTGLMQCVNKFKDILKKINNNLRRTNFNIIFLYVFIIVFTVAVRV